MTKPKLGRPPKPPGTHTSTPARQAGRIPDDEWNLIKAAAAARGETHSAAIRRVMGQWAKRVLRKS